jgi:hypothetical protein
MEDFEPSNLFLCFLQLQLGLLKLCPQTGILLPGSTNISTYMSIKQVPSASNICPGGSFA